MKHEWECKDCGRFASFSESKNCAICGGEMYFDEVKDFRVAKLKAPTPEQIKQALEDEEDDDTIQI
jgi:rRNA maturation endonuclease Nob1